MSWTFNEEVDGAKEFKDAISLAMQKGVLLFSSLREAEDALVIDKLYPVSLSGVFKIGSATRSGNQANTVSGDSKSAEFILPGREVLLRSGAETSEIQGSSVATALASGLAALIIFCADLIDLAAHTDTQRGQKLRSESKMRSVLGNMSRGSNEGKYPEVQKYFERSGGDLTLENISTTLISLTAGVCIPKFFPFLLKSCLTPIRYICNLVTYSISVGAGNIGSGDQIDVDCCLL